MHYDIGDCNVGNGSHGGKRSANHSSNKIVEDNWPPVVDLGSDKTRSLALTVNEKICQPFTAVSNSLELVQVCADALQGHWSACKSGHILHYDVDNENILLVRCEDGSLRGVLAGHNLRSPTDRCGVEPHGKRRSGTWEFISAYLLEHPDEPHTLIDDRESQMHVLTLSAMLYCKSNITSTLLQDSLRRFQDRQAYAWDEGSHDINTRSGLQRRIFMLDGTITKVDFLSSPLNDVFRKVLRPIQGRYALALYKSYAGSPLYDLIKICESDVEEAKAPEFFHTLLREYAQQDALWVPGDRKEFPE